jgi:hypothetical protein
LVIGGGGNGNGNGNGNARVDIVGSGGGGGSGSGRRWKEMEKGASEAALADTLSATWKNNAP